MSVVAIILTYAIATAQPDDSLFYRHSNIQLNVAGLGIERWAAAYEYRMSPTHAIFFQGGGSFPYLSEKKEYGFGLQYRYFFKPVKDAKFLWLFRLPWVWP